MKKRNANRKTGAQRLSGILDVPLDMVADVPRLTLNDNRELTVENYKSIEGYEPEEIKLRGKNYRIIITGRALQIVGARFNQRSFANLKGDFYAVCPIVLFFARVFGHCYNRSLS